MGIRVTEVLELLLTSLPLERAHLAMYRSLGLIWSRCNPCESIEAGSVYRVRSATRLCSARCSGLDAARNHLDARKNAFFCRRHTEHPTMLTIATAAVGAIALTLFLPHGGTAFIVGEASFCLLDGARVRIVLLVQHSAVLGSSKPAVSPFGPLMMTFDDMWYIGFPPSARPLMRTLVSPSMSFRAIVHMYLAVRGRWRYRSPISSGTLGV